LEINQGLLKKLQSGITLVTGGAGFIGSHIVDNLISTGLEVLVLDNLSNGQLSNLKDSKKGNYFKFIKKDLNDVESLENVLKNIKSVFHLAANPEVRTGFNHPEIVFKENIQNTFHLLEQIRKSNVETIVFASSSTVYGEPEQIPTPENYGPLIPISLYGASKLACEAMVSSYCYNYGLNGLIFRFANVVGSRSNHGVIVDFIKKLKKNNTKLEILGDGKQSKSYLHVDDVIKSFFFCLSKKIKGIEIFNVGNTDVTNVMEIAKIVCSQMNLKEVDIIPTGGIDNGRGWKGDVKRMHLDITKIQKNGWYPKLSSTPAVELATTELLQEMVAKKNQD